MKPGTAKVLELLREFPEGVTPLLALREGGGLRLSGRIFELRAEGYRIDTERDEGRPYGRYRLLAEPSHQEGAGL